MEQYEKMGGKGNGAAEALIQLLSSSLSSTFKSFLLRKWSRGLRLFEEHARRAKLREPYHKFDCDLHVLVAKYSVESWLAA